MTNVLWVGIGGFIGAASRYLLSTFVGQWSPWQAFPVGTLMVNTTGSLIIGMLGGFLETYGPLSPPVRMFLFMGVLGGFTTFSTFSMETLTLWRTGGPVPAFVNMLAHLALGLGAVSLGHWVGTKL